ncbi:Zinc finger CCCH domain-containing protein 4 [Astathelohania contejeani]|uniref:Zinc finger CCCH domain-containing protein 4 n=1 Tax=Astathelohania contejeani TaxID=164912 RepID=A0ABQ7HX18_9MICR|nr:Zinc finger CCCH domain-containing protein 4 [Thelohania contejeani]
MKVPVKHAKRCILSSNKNMLDLNLQVSAKHSSKEVSTSNGYGAKVIKRDAGRNRSRGDEESPKKRKLDVLDIKKRNYNYKTELCKFFLNKSCTRGDDCTYSHDTHKYPCKAFHLRNNCSRKNCMFSHEPIKPEILKQLEAEEFSAKTENGNIFISPLEKREDTPK